MCFDTAVRGCVNTGLDTVRLAPNSLLYFLSSGEEEGLLVVGEEAEIVVVVVQVEVELVDLEVEEMELVDLGRQHQEQ